MEFLGEFFDKMKADIIVGANYGDEGKGTVVATCAKHSDGKILNILTNGGAQRAHSILTDAGSFTFQHFGSASYYGAYNYFSEFFIINPMQFAKEREELIYKGVKPIVFRDEKCRWSTPFDMMANEIIEQLRGDQRHGSCGMGIWETICRFKNRNLSMCFDDFMKIFNREDRVSYLQKIKKYYEEQRIGCAIPNEWKHIWDNPYLIDHFLNDCQYLYDNSIRVMGFASAVNGNGIDHLIFENGQGLMLSDTGKDIAGTTPSLTGCDYSAELLKKIGGDIDVNLHYVTRSYLTRHGRGHMNNEIEKKYISSDIKEDRTNHYNEFQESFRYGEMSNAVMLKMHDYIWKDAEKIRNGKIIIDVTHCDEVDKEKEFKNLFDNVVTYDSALIK